MNDAGETHLAARSPVGRAGALGAVTVALLWALCYPLITTAVRYAPPLQIGALRAVLAGFVLVALGLLLGRPSPRGRGWLAVIAIGACSTGMGFAGMFLAGGRIGPGIATVIANTQPLLAALIGYFALGERLVGWQAAGMAAAFAGIAIIAVPAVFLEPSAKGTVSAAGVAFVLMAAVGVAAGNVIMKRFAARLDPIVATGWQLLAGGILLLLLVSLWGPSGSISWTVPFLLALTGLAIPGTAIAFALWFALIRRAPLNALNVFSFLTPVFALAIGAALYDERFSGLEIAGGGFVIAGAWMASRRKRGAASDFAERAGKEAA